MAPLTKTTRQFDPFRIQSYITPGRDRDRPTFCTICRERADPSGNLVRCYECSAWIHPECINIDSWELQYYMTVFCPNCPRIRWLKKAVISHRLNRFDVFQKNQPVQVGSKTFVETFQHNDFRTSTDIKTLDATDLSVFNEERFNKYSMDLVYRMKNVDMVGDLFGGKEPNFTDLRKWMGEKEKIEACDSWSQKQIFIDAPKILSYLRSPTSPTALYGIWDVSDNEEIRRHVKIPEFVEKESIMHVMEKAGETFEYTQKNKVYFEIHQKHSYRDFGPRFCGSTTYMQVLKGKQVIYITPVTASIDYFFAWFRNRTTHEHKWLGQYQYLKNLWKVELNEGDAILICGGAAYCAFSLEDSLIIGTEYLSFRDVKGSFLLFGASKSETYRLRSELELNPILSSYAECTGSFEEFIFQFIKNVLIPFLKERKSNEEFGWEIREMRRYSLRFFNACKDFADENYHLNTCNELMEDLCNKRRAILRDFDEAERSPTPEESRRRPLQPSHTITHKRSRYF